MKIIEEAMGYLKNKILIQNADKYEVNFSNNFKILIKEAK